jgi:hypothetical protein
MRQCVLSMDKLSKCYFYVKNFSHVVITAYNEHHYNRLYRCMIKEELRLKSCILISKLFAFRSTFTPPL